MPPTTTPADAIMDPLTETVLKESVFWKVVGTSKLRP